MAEFFVRRPIVAMVIAIVIVILGVVSLRGLPIAQYPDITPPMVNVTATYTGANATSVEQSVATPIEQKVNGVEDMIYMKSINSSDGEMSLEVSFDVATDRAGACHLRHALRPEHHHPVRTARTRRHSDPLRQAPGGTNPQSAHQGHRHRYTMGPAQAIRTRHQCKVRTFQNSVRSGANAGPAANINIAIPAKMKHNFLLFITASFLGF
ncbi:MAG: efflux RND transporter permease subunit, partial [Myxococcota bacterium]